VKVLCAFSLALSIPATVLPQPVFKLLSPGDYITSGLLIPVNIGTGIMYRHKKPLTEENIRLLDPLSVNGFDRPAIKNFSIASAHTSDALLIGSLAAPLFLLADKGIRDEAGVCGVIYFETLGITAAEVTFIKSIIPRARPFVYNANAPMREKLKADANCSFFSGHTAMTAAACFFTAGIYTGIHGPKYDWMWAVAAVPPVATGFFRYKAGKHFVTDIIAGLIVGSANGYILTQLHTK
jgi:membrane-associated phospholipid phosphatase